MENSNNFSVRCQRLASLSLNDTIIAVDFDGTCVEHKFPEIGDDVPGAVQVLRALNTTGAKLILWTIRSDQPEINDDPHAKERADLALIHPTTEYLKHAIRWFVDRSIQLDGANINYQQREWSSSPKAYAHAYIDDAALGCPLIETVSRPYVDWNAMCSLLISRFAGRGVMDK